MIAVRAGWTAEPLRATSTSEIDVDPQIALDTFIARYTDSVAAQLRAARQVMRARLPGAVELVYDNYNALVIAYAATERVADIVFSLAAYPRWVTLFFAQGATLDDPVGRLRGDGVRIRHIVLADLAVLEAPGVQALMDQALALATPFDGQAATRMVIKSVSARQRPRRPS